MKETLLKQFLVLIGAVIILSGQSQANTCASLNLMGGYKLCVGERVVAKDEKGNVGFYDIVAFFPAKNLVRMTSMYNVKIVEDVKVENVGVLKGEMAGLKIKDVVHPFSVREAVVIVGFFPYLQEMYVKHGYSHTDKVYYKWSTLPIKDIGVTVCQDCKPK